MVNCNLQYIRAFDLGGNGLKTALLSYDKSANEMKLVSSQFQLGKCPANKKVYDWAREQIKTIGQGDLDAEVKKGYLFGFSLAGLDKLSEKRVITTDMAKVFKLPADKVQSIHDGFAHLLASVKMVKNLPKGRIWNFSIGTGVGLGFTDTKHKLYTNDELKRFFGGIDAWEALEPTTKKEVWEACSSKEGFDKIVSDVTYAVNDKAFELFAERWKAFLKEQVIKRSKTFKRQWGKPKAIVFTGGHIEHHGDRLIKELRKRHLQVKMFEGPKNAGLFGAAWNVVRI